MTNKHIFAIFYPELSTTSLSLHEGSQIVICDDTIISRIMHVLRLSPGDECILFDRKIEIACRIAWSSKRKVECTIISVASHRRSGMSVTALLPLLKKEDFDASLYALAAVGVEVIQLIITEKAQRSWNGSKDRTRAEHIMIAAAEQSKYFSMPTIQDPQPLVMIMNGDTQPFDVKIVADPAGKPIEHLITSHNALEKACMLVGPEGGLTEKELHAAHAAGFISYRLTPTILKAEHAVTIMSGLLRSLFTKN